MHVVLIMTVLLEQETTHHPHNFMAGLDGLASGSNSFVNIQEGAGVLGCEQQFSA